MELKKWTQKIGIVIAILGVMVVLVLAAGFFAVKWHWTDVPGIVDMRSQELQRLAERMTQLRQDEPVAERINLCKVGAMGMYAGTNAQHILSAYERTKSGALLINMVEAASTHLEQAPGNGYAEKARQCETGTIPKELYEQAARNMAAPNVFVWMNTGDWSTFKAATTKDRDVITRVGSETGVEPRMIVAQLVAEQLRLFNSDREVYKRFFEPLKMLGSETKFSLGVTGIKEETAIKIEEYAKDPTSPFYPGPGYEHLLDFKTGDVTKERYDRITDEHNHYYAYLYTALYIREIEMQWQRAGFDIAHRPEIMSTLFNIGFTHSKPNDNPQTGGAMIEIAGEQYSFGSLGYEFYYSGELMDEFPYQWK